MLCSAETPTSSGQAVPAVAASHLHARALQPITAEERGPRPSAADRQHAQSTEKSASSSDSTVLYLVHQESPFTDPQTGRGRRNQPFKGTASVIMNACYFHSQADMQYRAPECPHQACTFDGA